MAETRGVFGTIKAARGRIIDSVFVVYETCKKWLKKYSTADREQLNSTRKRFAESYVYNVWFILSFGCALLDLILTGMGNNWLRTQTFLLDAGTVLFLCGWLATAYYFIENDGELTQFPRRFIKVMDGEVIFELGCFILGWSFIFSAPGVACLRLFRLFRYFLIYEIMPKPQQDADYNPEEAWMSIPFIASYGAKYLGRLAEELFTENCKGGVVILIAIFFFAYVLALVFWQQEAYIQTVYGPTSCHSLLSCYLTMVRLAFGDGAGFDYIVLLADAGMYGSVSLLVIYFTFCGILLFNILIGVFSWVFVHKVAAAKEEVDVQMEADSDHTLQLLADMTEKLTEMREIMRDNHRSSAERDQRIATQLQELNAQGLLLAEPPKSSFSFFG